MKRIFISAICLLAVGQNTLTLGSNPSPVQDSTVEQRIERVVNGLLPSAAFRNQGQFRPKTTLQERMARFNTPGVSIAVVNDYKIEWAHGFGIKQQGKRDPVTETTLFQAASISKPVFALAVMRLVQEGKLDLDEDVNTYLTSWKVPSNGTWQPKITLRQILSHTAGLTVHGFPGYNTKEKLPTLIDVLNGAAPANTLPIHVDILPGIQTRYSGGGTTLAGQLVADLLGKPLPKILHELVLHPLQMDHSTFEQPIPSKWAKHAAIAHQSKARPVDGKWHTYPEIAPDGLWTTPSDLARVGIELQLALKGDSNRYLSKEMATRMLEPVLESVSTGFMLVGKDQSDRFGHGGSNEGFLSQMIMYKHHGLGAVIMVNSNEGYPLIREIERAIAREYNWPDYFPEEKKVVKLSPEVLEKYVGKYVNESGFKCTVTLKNQHLQLEVENQPPLELQPESETKFFINELNTEVSFKKTSEGKVENLTLQQDNRNTVADRK